jgi:phosphoribosylformylglycinamidine synthase
VKVRVLVTPKPGVLDPEGRAIERALHELGYTGVQDVRAGKVIVLDLDTNDPDRATALAREMCDKLLANPVIEQYRIEIVEGEEPASPVGRGGAPT